MRTATSLTPRGAVSAILTSDLHPSDELKAFRESYAKQFKVEATPFAETSYDSIIMLAEVIKNVKSTKPTDLQKGLRVLTEDRPENRGFFSEGVEVVVEMMINPQGQINHFDDLGDDLRAASEPCEEMTNVAVVLFDRDRQIFACEELVLRDEAVIAVPIIGDERFAFDADFVEELLACGVITATKNPGDGSPSNRVIGPPNPQFCSLFFT